MAGHLRTGRKLRGKAWLKRDAAAPRPEPASVPGGREMLGVGRAQDAADELVGAGVALEDLHELGRVGDVDGPARVLRRLVVGFPGGSAEGTGGVDRGLLGIVAVAAGHGAGPAVLGGPVQHRGDPAGDRLLLGVPSGLRY